MNLVLNCEQDTQAFGKKLAEIACRGDVFLLIGDLGAGKTFLVRCVADAFGCADMVASPTFNIMNRYQNDRVTINHFDLYRIGDEDELLGIGFEDFLDDGIVFIEWPEPALGLLDDDRITTVSFRIEEEKRIFTVTGKYEDALHDYFGS